MTRKKLLEKVEEKLWQAHNEILNTYGEGFAYSHIDGIMKLLNETLPEDLGEEGTLPQNAAFHALLQEFYTSGQYSYPGVNSMPALKKMVKRYLGKGFKSRIVFVERDGKYESLELSMNEKIPVNCLKQNGQPIIYGVLWSWRDYTKTERKSMIDRLIADMDTAGVSSRKYHEILQGMADSFGVDFTAQNSGEELAAEAQNVGYKK